MAVAIVQARALGGPLGALLRADGPTIKSMDQPTPETIKAARTNAGHTQAQAAAIVHTDGRTWRRWELGAGYESGRAIPLAAWELYLIKTGQQKT